MFTNRRTSPEHFRIESPGGQNILRPLPEPTFADVRFFVRGPALDGTDGWASRTVTRLKESKLLPLNFGERPLIAPLQVHGVDVLTIDVKSDVSFAIPEHPKADGVFLLSHDFEASLRFADCAPVLILPSEKWVQEYCPWALLLHSGYKGTVQNIVASGLKLVEQKLASTFGPQSVHETICDARAWVFPCIAGDDYPRTLEDWTKRGLEIFRPENVRRVEHELDQSGFSEHYYFDIAGELRLQLLDYGLSDSNIYLSPWTSAGAPELCYSYRRGDTDRMFLHVALKPYSNRRKCCH